MILDLQNLPASQPLQTGLCIVGAGAVGIAIALELEEAGFDILLLEAGSADREDRSQDFYRGAVINPDLHSPLEQHRERRFGGTTTIWGGRCVPYDPIDFEHRPWIADSDWPISYEDVRPYFPKANQLCEAGEFDYNSNTAFPNEKHQMIAGFNGQAFTTNTLERFSCPTDFGQRYRNRLEASKQIRVVLNAAVTNVELNETGNSVNALEVRNPSGDTVKVVADHFVLGAGGLETTRLLLASRDTHKDGIGNQYGMLGHYYMAHIAGTVGSFLPSAGKSAVWNQYEIADDGTYCRRRLALTPEAQRQHKIGNFIARLHHTRIADPSHGSGVLSALLLGQAAVPVRFRGRLEGGESTSGFARHAGNVLLGLPGVVRFAYNMGVSRRFAARKYPSVVIRPKSNRYSLDFHAEQEPNYNSQVRLSSDKDAFGMPRLEVDWRYTPKDLETIATSLALFAEDARSSHSGEFSYSLEKVESEMTRYGAYGGHHLGTTRMGSDPKLSIVDANCTVHDVHNLHVAGGSVLTTSSQANPTLTVIALALRLADHLRTTVRSA